MKIHFIGLGGIGMSALARICNNQGHQVSGSDQRSSLLIETLQKEGICFCEGNFSSDMTVVVSSAIPDSHLELKAARQASCRILHRSDLLADLTEKATTCAVSGTHGKTTVSSLLAHVLFESGLNPSYCLGGLVSSLGSNGCWNEGGPFVIEADESDGTFEKYCPSIGIVTNIDDDHLDHFGSLIAIEAAFTRFMLNSSVLFICGDDQSLLRLAPHYRKTYGFSADCDYRLMKQDHTLFSIHHQGKIIKDLSCFLPGEHQMRNAAAVVAVCLHLGIPEDLIRKGLKSFKGVKRRSERLCKIPLIIDDYAHHPTEIEATLKGIKAIDPDKQLVCVFQPHRFSRTQECLDKFSSCFKEADSVFVTEIYGAGEDPIEGVDHHAVVERIGLKSRFVERAKIVETLFWEKCFLTKKIVFLGAGDVTHAAHDMAQRFAVPCSL